jgi:hypothetical protein
MNRSRRNVVCALAIGLALSIPTAASGVPQMSLPEVLKESRAVVHGVVVDQFSQWEEFDGNKIIFTYSTLRVEHADFLRLAPAREVVVRNVGGTVDGYTQVLIDEASFQVGEEVVVFLGLEDDWLHLSVVGFHQGKYEVVRDTRGRMSGLRQALGAQTEPRPEDARPVVPMTRFAADLKRARTALLSGDTSDVHPLVPVR